MWSTSQLKITKNIIDSRVIAAGALIEEMVNIVEKAQALVEVLKIMKKEQQDVTTRLE